MNWRLIKPFTFSLLFASQTRRHWRILNILVFHCIRSKPLFYDAKYWYKLCIKWLATNCSPFSASSPVAGHNPGKVPKTFPSGFCICYWDDIRMAEAFLSPKFSEGRRTLNSCARVPRAAGLLADGWWRCFPGPELGSFMGDKSVEPRITVGLGVRAPGLGVLAELPEEGSNRELPWQGDTHLHVTVGLSVCLQNVPALLLYFSGWLCEDCCVLSLVVFWEDLNLPKSVAWVSAGETDFLCFHLLVELRLWSR